MGLLDVFTGQYPSGDWAPNPSLVVAYDFDQHTLCGTRVGLPLDRFRHFGPAEDKSRARKGILCYYSRGFWVESKDEGARTQVLLGFSPTWGGLVDASAKTFTGPMRYRGADVKLGPQTTDMSLMTQFGPPAATELRGKAGAVVIQYAIRDVTYEFEFNDKKILQSVAVSAEPES
jgi:hypothetical protein